MVGEARVIRDSVIGSGLSSYRKTFCPGGRKKEGSVPKRFLSRGFYRSSGFLLQGDGVCPGGFIGIL